MQLCALCFEVRGFYPYTWWVQLVQSEQEIWANAHEMRESP